MRYLLLFIMFFVVTSATKVRAQDHLVPEQSMLSDPLHGDYYLMISDVFKEAYGSDVLLRSVVLPSFRPEYVVFLKKQGGQYNLILLSLELQLYSYENLKDMKSGRSKVIEEDGTERLDAEGIKLLESIYPEDYKDVEILRKEILIEKEVADQMVRIWQDHLLNTKHTLENFGSIDGVSYHFSMRASGQDSWSNFGQNISGQTHSANDSENMNNLIGLVHRVAQYAQHGNDQAKSNMVQALDANE